MQRQARAHRSRRQPTRPCGGSMPSAIVRSAARSARVHSFSVVVDMIDRRQRMGRGLARADMGSLRDLWRQESDARSFGLLDGLATAIRFRLSSRAWQGAWAGPDAMEAGVVFAGCIIPPDGLPKAQAPAAGPRARSGRDGVGVVCLCLGSGWSPWAAMMPILRMSVGGHRPQFPVTESMRFRCLASLSVLATLADDEMARKDKDINPPRLFKVVGIGHKIALRSQAPITASVVST